MGKPAGKMLSRLKRRGGGESDGSGEAVVDGEGDDTPAVDSAGAETESDPDVSGASGVESAAAPKASRWQRLKLPQNKMGAWLDRPMTSFHLIISVAALLVTLGLIMVLSASGVHSYDEDGTPWAIFGRQVIWTVLGLFACWIALRMPVRFLRRTAFSGFAFTIVLLVLVLIPGIGHESNGTRGWFVVAGLSMQPSELTKIAFAIWGAHILATRRMEHASLRELLVPLLPAAVIALSLIVAQPDLGQTVSLGIILLALLWYAGLPLKGSSARCCSRWERRRCSRCPRAIGPTACGPGSTRAPTPRAPDTRPDRPSSCAGERRSVRRRPGAGDGEMELPAQCAQRLHLRDHRRGTRVHRRVRIAGPLRFVRLYGHADRAGARPIRSLRMLTATATMWVIGQVFINVGYVIGLLPVTGIQLPLISAGGTSTATTLFMIGLVANAARNEPEAVAAFARGPR